MGVVRRAWLVRSGDGAEDIDALRRAGMVALRFPRVGDVRRLALWEIEQAIDPTPAESAAQLRSRLLRFANDIGIGDLVIMPNHADAEVWFADITGPYERVDEPTVPGFHHARPASWIGWAGREAPWLRHKLPYLDAPGLVIELRDPGWWFTQMSGLDLPRDRPVRPARRSREPVRAVRERASRPTASRAPSSRAAAPKAPPAPKPPELVLCAGQCGLQWRPSVLVDGLCPDCRM